MPVREWALGRRAPVSPALKSVLGSHARLGGNRPPVHFRTRLFLPQHAKRTLVTWRRRGFELMSADIGLQIAVNGAERAMTRLSLPDTPRASVGASITTLSKHSRRIEPINVHNFITIAMEVERRSGAG